MPINQVDVEQMVQECFDGHRNRNCDYCPAHYRKGGDCCFGHRYESHDPTCKGCIHSHSCKVLTHRKEQEEGRYQPPGYVPTRTSVSRTAQNSIRRPGGDLLSPQNSVQAPMELDPDMSFVQQMGLHALWGAVEGMLEMLLGFFRRRRPD